MSSSSKLITSFLFVFIALLILFLSLGIISSSDLKKSDSFLKISTDVTTALESNDSIRVFIQLKNESSESLVVNELGQEDIINDFGITLSATVSAEDIAVLKNNSEVEQVSLVGLKRLFLQDSVNITNASKSWSLQISGLNLTGKGQAVCIIDTGVNYLHSDFGGCFGNNVPSSTCKVVGGWNTVTDDTNLSDLNGHGTHVSGIVAANGSITGVAPEAKIVFVKAYNDVAGGFYDNDLIEAINWCVNNASLFNISVISMSLGGAINNTNYCDSNHDSENSYLFAAPINAAAAKNISVVIAAGNSGNYTGISSPACIQNATPVGWSDKSDAIYTSSNRNFMVQLFAPGSSIVSTSKTGGSATMSGTSMATPHVAGAIAILGEYLSLTSQTKTPQQLESILNSTGRQLTDAGSGLKFSRINIYGALLSLNQVFVTLISPNDNNFTNLNFTNFNCSADTYSSYTLKNITFYLWNSSNGLVKNETKTINGISNSSIFNYTFSNQDSYRWNCLGFNNVSNLSWANANRTITYDITAPVINSTSPVNDSSYTTADTISFSYSLLENFNMGNCSLIANNVVVLSNSTIGNSSSSIFSTSFSAGNYNWNINCSDSAGNPNFSETRNFTVTQYTSPSGGGNHGGGGGGSKTLVQSVGESQMLSGYTQSLSKGNKLTFRLQDNSSHSLTLMALDSSSINLTLASNPFNVTLTIGQELKINLSSSEYYDLYLRLNSITNNKANITIQSISESILVKTKIEPITGNLTKYPSVESTEVEDNPNNYITYSIIIIVLVIFILIIINFARKDKNKSFKKKK